MRIDDVETRVAEASDVDAIADAHRDSIRSIGPAFYPPDVVAAWAEGLDGGVYRQAMAGGEVFFIATGPLEGATAVLGFASDYRIEGATHGISAYVRGAAARRGIGSLLLRLAEAHALGRGAMRISIESSLAAVAFYQRHGFVEVERGVVMLRSGRPIAVVAMRKDLVPHSAAD
jgi:putative acetyltransferase